MKARCWSGYTFATRACPRCLPKFWLSPFFAVHGCQYDRKCVSFHSLLHAVSAAGTRGDTVEPPRRPSDGMIIGLAMYLWVSCNNVHPVYSHHLQYSINGPRAVLKCCGLIYWRQHEPTHFWRSLSRYRASNMYSSFSTRMARIYFLGGLLHPRLPDPRRRH